MTSKKYKGVWLFENTPDALKLFGDLTISENGVVRLELVDRTGVFEKVIPGLNQILNDVNGNHSIRFISGYAKEDIDNDDLAFTLINSRLVKFSRSGLSKVTFEADYLLDIYQIHDEKDLEFKMLFFRLKYFNEWVGENGFDVSSDNNKNKFNVHLDYESPDPIYLYQSESLNVYFYHRASAPVSGHGITKFNLEEKVYLNFEYANPQRFKDLIDVTYKMQFLFALLFGFDPFRLNVSMRHDKSDHETNVYYYEYLKTLSNYYPDYPRFLFPFEEFKLLDFKDLIDGWFKLYDDKELALTLFRDLYFQKNRHVITKFTGYIMAMESYIQTKGRLWKNVIKPVFERNKKVSELFVEDIDTYSKTVADVRVYYVHGNKREYFEDQYLDLKNVIKMGQIVETIIHGYLLSKIGVPEEMIFNAFNKSVFHSHFKL